MAKYKYYDYSQSVMVPVCLEDQLMPGTLEFAIHTLVENRMDMSIFDNRYQNDETGRWAYDPKILLKVVLFGYSRGLISSRKLERACKENIIFMALSCGQQPDHCTIAAFVSSMKDEILSLFRDVLLVCEEENLLDGTMFALDGCKLPSNASTRMSGTISEIDKKKERIEKRVKHLLEEQVNTDKRGDRKGEEVSRKEHIERFQKKASVIKKWLEDNKPKVGKQGREIKSNVTDNESGMMVGSHGVIQGYNGQALVDQKRQVIVSGEAFGTGDDHHLIPPILDDAKKNMKAIGHGEDCFKGKRLLADSNYHGPVNLEKCEEEGLDAYIPDKDFRKRDPNFGNRPARRSRRVKRVRLEDFHYDEDNDVYICPEGKILKVERKKAVIHRVVYRRYVSDEKACSACQLKRECLRGKNAKRRNLCVPVGPAPGNLTKPMAKKIDSDEGRKIYSQRMGIVEPVFANIRTHKVMNRFTLRGKIKVNIQWLLYCMVHNIGKIMVYGFA
jgi:transposase